MFQQVLIDEIPLLSPRWANPKNLPYDVYLVGAEYDMLCYEARERAESLVRYSAMNCERSKISGIPAEEGWQQGGIRWECARGRDHAFTHITKFGKKEKERRRFCQEMYSRVGCWLKENVWELPDIRPI
jgi:hypothetical protein